MKLNLNKYKDLFPTLYVGKGRWVIAVYVRLSKEDLRKRRMNTDASLSIVNQIRQIGFYLEDELDDFTIYDIYIDDGKTGTDFERSEYIRLMKDIDSGIVNTIIVKDLTRYARNFADGIKELDRFVLENHVRFISLEGYPSPDNNSVIDTYKDPTAISSSRIYKALDSAEDHARSTSIKIRSTKYMHQRSGEPSGGQPPYGFLSNPDPNTKTYLIDEVAQKVIRKIFKSYADGYSPDKIARMLNDENIPNPTAYKQHVLKLNYYNPHAENNSGLWSGTTIRRILTDKNHIGYSVQHKSSSFDHKRHKQVAKPKNDYILHKNAHEGTIDEDLFETVQKLHEQKTRVTKTGKTHIFANLVYCEHCNKALAKNKNGNNTVYLVCRTHRQLKRCKSTSIRFDDLESVVLEVVQTHIKFIAELQKLIDRINANPITNKKSSRLSQVLESTEKEIAKAEKIIDNSYYDWKNDDISREQYKRINQETEEKLRQLKATLASIKEEQYKLENGIQANNDYFTRFLKYQNIEKLDRIMLLEIIDKIYVNEDKMINIKFKYYNQFLLIIEYIEQNTNKLPNNLEIPSYQKAKKR